MRKTLLVDLRSVFKYRIKGAKSMAAYSATMGSASFLALAKKKSEKTISLRASFFILLLDM